MPDPAWPSSPPEANYLRLVGPGATGTATTLTSGAAWQAMVAATATAFASSTVNTTATAADFEGVGGMSSATAATGLNSAVQLLSVWVQEKPPIATAAVSAYENAVSSMIPAAVSVANRTEQAADVAINPLVLGALTPVIAALDAQYFGEFWPHNAATGLAYGAALAALVPALAVPPPLSPPGASPTAPAAAAAAIAQTAGKAAAGEAVEQSGQAAEMAGKTTGVPAQAAGQIGQMTSVMSQPVQSALGSLQPAMGMFGTPLQAVQSLAGMPQSMMGSPEAPLGAANTQGAGLGSALAAGAASLSGHGGATAGPGGVAGGGVRTGGGAAGAFPGAGLTSYTRPTGSFAPENAGRPAGLRTGLLSTAELRGPTTTGVGGTAAPVAPAQVGMLGNNRADESSDGRGKVPRARVVLGPIPAADAGGRPSEGRNS